MFPILKVLALILTFLVSAFAEGAPVLTAHDQATIKIAQTYFERVSTKTIVGAEYLATTSGERVETLWGHSALRLIDNDGDDFNDLIVSFMALTGEDRKKIYLKGLAGYYPLYPMVTLMASVLKNNAREGGRSFVRVPLTLTEHELSRFLYALQTWVANPELSPKYFFLNRNCSFGIFHLLDMADIRYSEKASTPHGVFAALKASSLTQSEPLKAYSSAPLTKKMKTLLKGVTMVKDLNARDLAEDLSTRELYILLSGDFGLNPLVIKALYEIYQARPASEKPDDLAKVYKIKKLEVSNYLKEAK